MMVAACAAGMIASPTERVNSLSAVLGLGAIVAGYLVVGERGGIGVSPSFIVWVLAAAFLGPLSAALAAVIGETAANLRLRTSPRTVFCANLPSSVVPAVAAAVIIRALTSAPRDALGFYLAVTLAAAAALVLSFLLFASLWRLLYPEKPQFGLRTLVSSCPAPG
jgi:ABC-type Co2+ transport system permease subunit